MKNSFISPIVVLVCSILGILLILSVVFSPFSVRSQVKPTQATPVETTQPSFVLSKHSVFDALVYPGCLRGISGIESYTNESGDVSMVITKASLSKSPEFVHSLKAVRTFIAGEKLSPFTRIDRFDPAFANYCFGGNWTKYIKDIALSDAQGLKQYRASVITLGQDFIGDVFVVVYYESGDAVVRLSTPFDRDVTARLSEVCRNDQDEQAWTECYQTKLLAEPTLSIDAEKIAAAMVSQARLKK